MTRGERLSALLAAVQVWQELLDSPAWREWQAALTVDLEVASDKLHGINLYAGYEATATGYIIAKTQYDAVKAQLEHPQTRIEDLRADIAALQMKGEETHG